MRVIKVFKLLLLASLIWGMEQAVFGQHESSQVKPHTKTQIPPDVLKNLQRLQHPRLGVRAYAAYHLGRQGKRTKQAIPFLIKALTDDTDLQWLPSRPSDMRPFENESYQLPEITEVWERISLTTLAQIRDYDSIVKYVLPGVNGLEWMRTANENTSLRYEAVRALEALGDEALLGLLAAKNDKDPEIRAGVAFALGRFEDERAINALAELLVDSDYHVASNAITSLTRLGEPALATIRPLLKNPEARFNAIWALAAIGDSESVQTIITVLSDEEPRLRAIAAKALGEMKDPGAVEPLISLLSDDEEVVRGVAAWALGSLNDKRAVEPLIPLLQDQHSGSLYYEKTGLTISYDTYTICIEAARALGQIGDVRACQPLIRLFAEKKPWFRQVYLEAVVAIDTLAVPFLVTALTDKNNKIRAGAAEALGLIKERVTIGPLAEAIHDSDKDVRKEVIKALYRINDNDAIEPLTDALQDPDKDVRESAIKTLYLIVDGIPSEPIIAAVRDDEKVVRRYAALILGKLNSKEVLTPLITTATYDKDKHVRENALLSLSKFKDERITGTLLTALNNDDYLPYVRARIANTLGELGDQRAVPHLLLALDDDHSRVTEAAAKALQQCAPAPETIIGYMNTQKGDFRKNAIRAFQVIKDSTVVNLLLGFLSDKDTEMRELSAIALIKQDHNRAIEPLIRLVDDEKKQVRRTVAGALGQLKDNRCVEPLIGFLNDKDMDTRIAAIKSLGQLKNRRALEPLMAALSDENPQIRWNVAAALGEIGGSRAAAKLVALLRIEPTSLVGEFNESWPNSKMFVTLLDKETAVRENAAWALGKIGHSSAVEPLLSACKNRSWGVPLPVNYVTDIQGQYHEERIAAVRDRRSHLRSNAAEALVMIGKPAVPHLISALQHENDNIRCTATAALGEIGDNRAVEPLLECLRDPDWLLRWYAAISLGKIADDRAVLPLVAVLQKDIGEVRSAAARALGMLKARQAVKPLIDALEDHEWRVRAEAVEALGEIGDSLSVQPLILRLADDNDNVRAEATLVLAKLGNKMAFESLLEKPWLLYDVDQAIVVPDSGSVQPLIYALRWLQSVLRRVNASSSGELREKHFLNRFFSFSSHSDYSLSQADIEREAQKIIWMLKESKDSRATEHLIRTLGDFEEETQILTAKALKELTGQDFGTNAEAWLDWWKITKGGLLQK